MPCYKTSMDFLSKLILYDEKGNAPYKPKAHYLPAEKGWLSPHTAVILQVAERPTAWLQACGLSPSSLTHCPLLENVTTSIYGPLEGVEGELIVFK